MCDEAEKLCWDFIWGTTASTRKCHLIGWNKICSPKEEGVWGSVISALLIECKAGLTDVGIFAQVVGLYYEGKVWLWVGCNVRGPPPYQPFTDLARNCGWMAPSLE